MVMVCENFPVKQCFHFLFFSHVLTSLSQDGATMQHPYSRFSINFMLFASFSIGQINRQQHKAFIKKLSHDTILLFPS